MILYWNSNQIIEMSVILKKKKTHNILQRQTNISDQWMGEKFLVFFFLEQFDKKHMQAAFSYD